MMALVINVPGLLFDFKSKDAREKYRKLEEQILTGKLKGKELEEGLNAFKGEKFELSKDAYSVEELSYRARIFLLSYLDSLLVKRTLVQFNLDAFISNVVSLSGMRFDSVRDLIDKVSKVTNSRSWILLTNSKLQADVFRGYGVKTVLVSSEGRFKDMWNYADSTSSHKVDESFYAKGCR